MPHVPADACSIGSDLGEPVDCSSDEEYAVAAFGEVPGEEGCGPACSLHVGDVGESCEGAVCSCVPVEWARNFTIGYYIVIHYFTEASVRGPK